MFLVVTIDSIRGLVRYFSIVNVRATPPPLSLEIINISQANYSTSWKTHKSASSVWMLWVAWNHKCATFQTTRFGGHKITRGCLFSAEESSRGSQIYWHRSRHFHGYFTDISESCECHLVVLILQYIVSADCLWSTLSRFLVRTTYRQ